MEKGAQMGVEEMGESEGEEEGRVGERETKHRWLHTHTQRCEMKKGGENGLN